MNTDFKSRSFPRAYARRYINLDLREPRTMIGNRKSEIANLIESRQGPRLPNLKNHWASVWFALVLSLASNIAWAADTVSYAGVEPNHFFQRWLVLGPISVAETAQESPDDESQKKAFQSDLLAAAGGESSVHSASGDKVKIGSAEFQWKLLASTNDTIDLTKTFGNKEYVVAYAYAEIVLPEKMEALAGVGSDDAIKIWLNGKVVHENWTGRPVQRDEDLVRLPFDKGTNRLLLKVQNMAVDWGFALRTLGNDSTAERLVSAAASGNVEVLELLLSRGASVNATNKSGVTPWHAARTRGRKEATDFLLSKGANAKAKIPPVEQRLDALFKDIVNGEVPGAAVLVARAGEILFEKGYGYASLEHHIPVTPETKFRIGSITKQFTSAAILKLQEEGKLSVRDKLSKFMPDYPRGDEVTIHHLLTHTSGIHSYTSKPDFFETVTAPIRAEDLIKWFKNDPFDFSPGEKWSYCNSGYFLLGYIIEKVSGLSYEEFLKKNFFEPLGMKSSGVHHSTDILEQEATGYAYEQGKFKKALNWDMSRAGGAGAIYSTVEDLYRWNEGLYGGRVLNEASLKAAFTPVRTKADETSSEKSESGYGYGWMISKLRGLTCIEHGGGLQGFVSYLSRCPKENFTVVVLANAAPAAPRVEPGQQAHAAAEMYLWEKMEMRDTPHVNTAISSKDYDAYAGRYDYRGAVLVVTKEADRLFAQLTGQPKFEIFPKSDVEFFWKVVEAQVTFVKDEKGQVTKAIHQQGGMKFEAPKIADEPVIKLAPAMLKAYVGKYDYGEVKSIMTVTQEGGRLFAQLTGQPKFEILPKSDSAFFWKAVVAEVTFVKDTQGKVTKAIHSQGGRTFDAPRIE